jgi:PAS domain S-box-containing protein
MDKKSFWRLKQGKSELPSLEKIAQLAAILGASPHVVMAVAGGLPWEEMAEAVKKKDTSAQLFLLGRWASSALTTSTGPEYLKSMLFDGLCDFVFGVDLQGSIVACNRTSQTVLGFAPDELIGKHVNTMCASGQEGDRVLRRIRKAVKEEKPFRESFRFRRRDGTDMRGELSCAVLSDPAGKPWVCACILRAAGRGR